MIAPVDPHPNLSVEHRTARLELDGQREDGQREEEETQGDEGEDDVEATLHDALPARDLPVERNRAPQILDLRGVVSARRTHVLDHRGVELHSGPFQR